FNPVAIRNRYNHCFHLRCDGKVVRTISSKFRLPEVSRGMVSATLPKFSGEHLHVELGRDGKDDVITLKTRHHEPVQLDVSLVADTGTEIPVILNRCDRACFNFRRSWSRDF